MQRIRRGGALMHDERCRELATYFLDDAEDGSPPPEDQVTKLADLIQATVEDFLDNPEVR